MEREIKERRVALVTGAAGAIGEAIAIKLAESGYDVAIHGRKIDERLETLKEKLETAGCNVKMVSGDISSSEDCKQIIKETVDSLGSLYALINNAGITRDGLMVKMSDEDFGSVIENNLYSCFYTARAAFGYMMKAKKGVIVNISSVVGIHGNAGQANYSAAKAGVIGLTKTCAKEFARRGVRVNAIAPGYIETPMTEVISEDAKQNMKSRIALGRLGSPEDIANLTKFLVGEESSYITGQVITIDGGMSI